MSRENGVILKALSGFYYVDDGSGRTVTCRARGKFRHQRITPLVGDRVSFTRLTDGVGALDPVFVVLPNSGLLVRYNMLLGLNADGTPNQEAGTTPDILSPAGEHPLITALRAILS